MLTGFSLKPLIHKLTVCTYRMIHWSKFFKYVAVFEQADFIHLRLYCLVYKLLDPF